jgi:DNA-binding response OmpR family regulator
MARIGRRISVPQPAAVCDVVLVGMETQERHHLISALSDRQTGVTATRDWRALLAEKHIPDVIVLDSTSLIGVSLRVFVDIRRRWPCATIIAIAAPAGHVATQLLTHGADDVVDQGMSWEHLLARLMAAARRARTQNATLRSRVGDVIYSREDRRVWCASEEVTFAHRELEILDCLWRHADTIVPYDHLHDSVWAPACRGARVNRVQVYISALRRKLAHSKYVSIETVRGVGYRLAHCSPPT